MMTLEKLKALKNKQSSIKPCPICGGEAKIQANTYDPWGDGGGNVTDYWYECDGCGIIKGGRFDTYGKTHDEARAAAKQDWNEVVDYLNTIIIKENINKYER